MTDDTPTPALGGLRRSIAQWRLKRSPGGPPIARRIRAHAVERAKAQALSGRGLAPPTGAAQVEAEYESARRALARGLGGGTMERFYADSSRPPAAPSRSTRPCCGSRERPLEALMRGHFNLMFGVLRHPCPWMSARARARCGHTLVVVLALALLLRGAVPAGSVGTGTPDCGSVSFGAARGAFEITAKRVRCELARTVARRSRRHGGKDFYARGFRCRSRQVAVDTGGFRYRCHKGARRISFVTRLGPRRQIVLEAERGTGGGHTAYREDASGPARATIHLGTGETISLGFRIAEAGRYQLAVRYSNSNFGPADLIDISIDGRPLGRIAAEDTESWDAFAWSGQLGPVDLGPGRHAVTVTVADGDPYGWEIDVVRLDLAR